MVLIIRRCIMEEFLKARGLDKLGWEAGYYGDTFICPCGDEIEVDGGCEQGCVSPLVSMGLL